MIEYLADSLPDCMQRATSAGAGLVLDIEPHVLAGQMGPAETSLFSENDSLFYTENSLLQCVGNLA